MTDASISPPGHRILKEVASKYGIDVDAMLEGHGRRFPSTTARVEAARRMHEEARYCPSKIARIMRRDDTTIGWYLGRVKGREVIHVPGYIPLGPTQRRYLSVLSNRWMNSLQIANALGITWARSTPSIISRYMGDLLKKGVVVKGGMPSKPLWRRK